ncbi:MAG: hypothetical protein A2908_00040 [Candidatus Staskawiczbacteria bacterium RIFCSPLOWO2_01_FULL_38_12b]|uniref:Uncharacterized protein n=1 Tax=Candidatus Staskawiczbacteria bacterium RIFCSPLOWO2_01_FULL_38_12b TaxID=1802214 RepID=A0A1G2IDZ3_9BACT|nr:MAG: hypothetical protein A2908_00040 [Candidatus Staskawiczbacteria bacterium RIFCSPLOWO2_01_FULL_38_12b]
MTIEEKNYRKLVEKAELAFLEKRYLEAFLIQSCLIEGVIKSFAYLFLKPIFESHPDLKQKSNSFELARLIDELFMAGKINNKLYENLNKYRKKRNQVIHQILKFKDEKVFEKELKEAYRLGRDMKGFIVEEMVEGKKGKTTSELSAKFEQDSKIYIAEQDKALKPFFRKINRDLNKIFKKKLENNK